MPTSAQPAASSRDQAIAQLLYGSLYRGLSADVQQLVRQSIQLYTRERKLGIEFADYSFLVFPMAKAYEGFLKEYLLQMRLLSVAQYQDHRFRIGRALNPDVRHNQRDEQWLYDDIAQLCSPEVGRLLWDTWLQCRNQVFHFFPTAKQRLTLSRAGEYILLIANAMETAQRCERQNGVR